MISTLLHLLRLCPFLCGGHRQLALENLALRQQLIVYESTARRPTLRRSDRLFWRLSKVWTGWHDALVIVAPDTVLRWRRRRFRNHWTKISARATGGRPPVHAEFRRAHRSAGSSRRTPYNAVSAIHRAANLSDTSVSTALRNPARTVVAMVGHKTESIYRRYAIADESMLKDGADKLAALH